ncbi:DUF4340 domain-containing protein [Oscillibacter sp.]|uniref:DUF4340 domain-containing protein n=1 Tax=Oscillibacter sp. TaxID=1945593 RepID=UPI00262D9C59|nr:DUF4340 domain-containing protein [Oscillibacter sp.]MDD3346093.1 DUF4340 domain-containing protein [Oscillibacter sp.]
MTWKQRRTITVLSTILAILLAALLIVLGMKYRESLAAKSDPAAQAAKNAAAANSKYSALSYSNASTALSFSLREGGVWVWTDDPAFPLNDATVTSILETLSSLTPQQTISDPDTPESYGLDVPTATLTATVAADQSTVSVSFGKATTDGASYYAMMNGDSSTVYIFADTLFSYLHVPIYDMMVLPELPALKQEGLVSVTLQGPASEAGDGPLTVLLSQHADGDGGAVTWLLDTKDVTDNASVQALLEDLTGLSLARCVDYRPSGEAASICGLDSPAAQAAIVYQTGGGEETLRLTVGNPLPDGSGRYVRVGEDPSIYLLETAALDPLMRIAASGL